MANPECPWPCLLWTFGPFAQTPTCYLLPVLSNISSYLLLLWGPQLAMLRGFSWLHVQNSLPTVNRRPHGMPASEPRSEICKGEALPTTLPLLAPVLFSSLYLLKHAKKFTHNLAVRSFTQQRFIKLQLCSRSCIECIKISSVVGAKVIV